ncbi:MAG: citrate lyase subunit alpha [Acidobacteriota bacterium]|jgi:citrate lyase subunit alpha/citrate CoA-transferase|nr:citrate lyase subunit alpha [Acidobacteriota bacterium]
MSRKKHNLEINAAGRPVPLEVNGRPQVPFAGVGKYRPSGSKAAPPIRTCADYPDSGDKRVADIKTALERCGIRDGMTISTHHHMRDGDYVANMVFDAAAELGVKDLRWFPSASFPVHAPNIRHLESGVIHHIEGSMNGPLGDYCSQGKMRGTAVLRSHGGRWQAIQDGEVHIDIAVISAPTADPFGNANGLRGPAACGLLGFALADSRYADHVIVVTDNLEPFPCIPWQIQGNDVDCVVEVDSIGDPAKIVSGTTQLTRSPDRLYIAELALRFVTAAGLVTNGFSFQAGAGGTSLAFAIFLRDFMREHNIHARFMRGGSTRYMTGMLEEGLVDFLLDGQTFDLEGVRSMRENPAHQDTSPFTSYNYHGKGNFASMLDIVILGATEVDLDFNANVVTHSDGKLLHGIGGWQNCLFGRTVILPIPLFRDRIPVVVDKVTTICGPGELIDVVVTERGIAVNPRRTDLLDAVRDAGLPLRSIQELKEEAERVCGGPPAKPELLEKTIAVVKWVDGTLIDAVNQVKG